MIITVIKCEECDQTRPIIQGVTENAHEWITLFRGNIHPNLQEEGWHFCSQLCLARWATGLSSVESGKKS